MGEAPVRIQLRRTKGFRLQEASIALNGLPAMKVDRTTRFGNGFIMAHEGTRHLAIASFREQAEAQWAACPEFYLPLRGHNLACWCGLDKDCHGDILLEIVNRPLPQKGTSHG